MYRSRRSSNINLSSLSELTWLGTQTWPCLLLKWYTVTSWNSTRLLFFFSVTTSLFWLTSVSSSTSVSHFLLTPAMTLSDCWADTFYTALVTTSATLLSLAGAVLINVSGLAARLSESGSLRWQLWYFTGAAPASDQDCVRWSGDVSSLCHVDRQQNLCHTVTGVWWCVSVSSVAMSRYVSDDELIMGGLLSNIINIFCAFQWITLQLYFSTSE